MSLESLKQPYCTFGFKYFQFSLSAGASLQGLNKLEEETVADEDSSEDDDLPEEDDCDDEDILEDEYCPECEDVVFELLLDTGLLDVGFVELLLFVDCSLRELDTALSLKELLLVSSAEEKVAI